MRCKYICIIKTISVLMSQVSTNLVLRWSCQAHNSYNAAFLCQHPLNSILQQIGCKLFCHCFKFMQNWDVVNFRVKILNFSINWFENIKLSFFSEFRTNSFLLLFRVYELKLSLNDTKVEKLSQQNKMSQIPQKSFSSTLQFRLLCLRQTRSVNVTK